MIIINKINEYFRERHNLDNFKLSLIYLVNDDITIIGGGIYKRGEKGEIIGRNWKFNLSDPVEKQLSRINGFYNVLSSVYNDRIQILYDSVYYDEEERVKEAKKIYEESEGRNEMILLEWEGDGMEESAYNVYYDVIEDIIGYRYNDMDIKEEEKIIGELNRKEFNLLMQIYFGVYDDERLKKELEEKERKGEYEEIKKYISEGKELTGEEKEKMEDYLKLQLIRKPTEGAFPELKIKKIYDKNWDEERQRKVVEKINKELGKEVVVLE